MTRRAEPVLTDDEQTQAVRGVPSRAFLARRRAVYDLAADGGDRRRRFAYGVLFSVDVWSPGHPGIGATTYVRITVASPPRG